MVVGRLYRYLALRFLSYVLATFVGVVALTAMLDYVEEMRRGANWPRATAWLLAEISLLRVPQITEHVMPFAVLVGTMACYVTLSRRLELIIARAAGVSAWQFVAPAIVVALLLGALATMLYNPLAAILHERSKRLEAELQGQVPTTALQENTNGFWVRQKSADGAAILNAKSSRDQGAQLGGVSIYTFDSADRFRARIEAARATLEKGYWRLEDARVYAIDKPPALEPSYRVATSLTLEQVRENFATPETVPFWQLPWYIELADRAGLSAAGYRLQYALLLSRPFLLAAMVLLGASVSLRFFRFGGVQNMVLSGICAGFLLFVLSKITEDMSKAGLLSPLLAAAIPAVVGSLTGFVVLLYQEDG